MTVQTRLSRADQPQRLEYLTLADLLCVDRPTRPQPRFEVTDRKQAKLREGCPGVAPTCLSSSMIDEQLTSRPLSSRRSFTVQIRFLSSWLANRALPTTKIR